MSSNTYRAPTEEETQAYKAAIDQAIAGLRNHVEINLKAKAAIDSVFGPCEYTRLSMSKSQVTQRSPGEDGAQVRFEINAELS